MSWVDPLVGLRLRHQFAPGWNFVVSGDVGGFDVGSKFSWQVLAAFDYEICRSRTVTWSAMLGYKALSVDYSQGSGLTPLRVRHDDAWADIRRDRTVLTQTIRVTGTGDAHRGSSCEVAGDVSDVRCIATRK